MLPFDELNRLAGQQEPRSVDIRKYFAVMELPESEKEDRIAFAGKLEDVLFEALALLYVLIEQGQPANVQQAKSSLAGRIAALLDEYTYPDSQLLAYVENYVENFVETTLKHTADDESAAYWFSQDRARFNAEDETNALFNYEQYREAINNGYTRKQWRTMRDERVRLTHAEVEGMVIPIDGYFPVGVCMMRFPKDPEAGPEETVGCRCTIKYLR